jgi:Zn-dependent peptidase ImmA (M78 family)
VSGADASAQIEQYCNDVAGEILLPAAEVNEFPTPPTFEAAAHAISEFAGVRRISRSMVAYKLFRSAKIQRPMWIELTDHFRGAWLAQKQLQSEKQKAVEGGPSYYVVKRHRVGDALLGLMRRALDEGTTTYTKAGRVLGVKPTNVEPLLASGPIRGPR